MYDILGTISRNPSPTFFPPAVKDSVRVKIALVWAISFAISSPIMILGFINKTNILNNNQCVLGNNDFIIYGSVSAFFIPLGILGILFGFTIKVLQNQWKICDPVKSKTVK